jgi:hypothetical protein
MYVDGIDISGYIRDAGQLAEVDEAIEDTAVTDAVKNVLLGQGTISCGPLNAILDNDGGAYPAGLFSSFGTAGTPHYTTVVVGTPNGPNLSDPIFAWYMAETAFQRVEGSNGFVSVTLQLDKGGTGFTGYDNPWGYTLHAKGNESAVNSANTPLVCDWGSVPPAWGGLFVYHLFSATAAGAGTVVLKMQDSADGSTGWADVTNATSGALTTNVTTAPVGGIVPIGTTAVVKRYTRWQLVFGGGTPPTGANFFAGFVHC